MKPCVKYKCCHYGWLFVGLGPVIYISFRMFVNGLSSKCSRHAECTHTDLILFTLLEALLKCVTNLPVDVKLVFV